MREEAIKPNGDTFQNSPIHLLFYEKISNAESDLVPNMNDKPKLSSMSWCGFKKNSTINLPEGADELALLLVLENFTAQFVTKKQYLHLMFILGQDVNKTGVNQQNYMEILQLFNPYPTDTAENFKDMISQLQFPFVFDKKKTLGQSRHDFKDFFLV